MMDRAGIAGATGRLKAASSELADHGAAGEAFCRMAYLWARSVRYHRVLTETELHDAIRAFRLEYPNGVMAESGSPGEP